METKPDSVGVARAGNTTHINPTGSLSDLEQLESFKQAFDAAIAAGDRRVLVDLSASQVIGGAGLEQLMDCQDHLMRLGGWFKVANATVNVLEIFRITGFADYVSVAGQDGQHQQRLDQLRGSGKKRLGDLLLSSGFIEEAQLTEALRLQKDTGKRLGRIVVERGWVSDQDLLSVLGEQLNVPYIRLRSRIYDPEAVKLLDKEIAKRLKVLPLFRVRGVLFLATANPQAIPVLDEVEERVGVSVRPILAGREDILQAINEADSNSEYSAEIISLVDDDFEVVENAVPDDYTEIDQMAAGSPVINLVNSLIQRAVQDGASDVHIEPFRTHSRIRYRIDGLLYEFQSPRIELHAPMVSRLKVMANLDISERRLPQDGRIQVVTQGRSVDLRFSSLPGLFGEKVVLRVLDKNQAILDLNKLGMSDYTVETFKSLLGCSNGLILVTGPTGSGKTTSLYAALNYLNSIEKNIVTIEDPVEYQIDIINQNEVKADIGLSFAKLLKHVLRQDPDIIMVGEIRERETAEIAVQAALTGHLVLSTLHTNDSIGAVTRMIDMGVEPYLLSSALIGVIAQRLVRTVCPSCKTTFMAPPQLVEQYKWQDLGQVKLVKGRGCSDCYDSGFKGRLGIHEALKTDPKLQRLIIANPSRDELTDYLAENEGKTLFQDGLERVLEGQTTIEEVTRSISI